MEEILMKVSPEGKVQITTKGFKGKACKEATMSLEQALGVVTKDTPTREANEHGAERVSHRSRS